MNVGLDTSVILRLLTGRPPDQALAALRFLEEREQARDRVLVSDWVLAEAYYALQHHYGATKADTLAGLRDFLATSGVEGTGDVPAVLETPNLATIKPGFVDRVIHRNYLRSSADQVATFDRAARRLPGAVVLEG